METLTILLKDFVYWKTSILDNLFKNKHKLLQVCRKTLDSLSMKPPIFTLQSFPSLFRKW